VIGGLLTSTTLAAGIASGPDISDTFRQLRINATPRTRLGMRPREADASAVEGIGEMNPALSYCGAFV
jgi:hypothetical protein